MNTAVIMKRFFNDVDVVNIAGWANGLIGDYLPEDCRLQSVIVNSITSIQVVPLSDSYLAVLLVEVWCPEEAEQ